MSRLRNICFTLNNYTEEEIIKIKEINYSFIVLGYEIGEKGTPHIQGYIEFLNARSFKSLTKMFFKRAHLENRKGFPKQAAGYCLKGESPEVPNYSVYFDKPGINAKFFMDGTITEQGKRSDIEKVVEFINDGNNLKDIATVYPCQFVKFNKGFEKLINITVEPRNTKPTVTILWGDTGTGKSYKARQLCNNEPYYIWTPSRGHWWDGYQHQKNIIMEEFRGQLPFDYILTLLDRYECPIQFKGGTTEFVGTNIIITSPIHPGMWYNNDENKEQLFRRITCIENLEEKYIDTEVFDTEVAG